MSLMHNCLILYYTHISLKLCTVSRQKSCSKSDQPSMGTGNLTKKTNKSLNKLRSPILTIHVVVRVCALSYDLMLVLNLTKEIQTFIFKTV